MAFRFFRRRQKMVIIIMVALMVSFLVGIQGMEMFFGGGGGDSTVGASRFGDVDITEVWTADRDRELVGKYLGRSLPIRAASIGEANLAFALLLKEAEANEIIVSDADVDGFLASLGMDVKGAQYKALLSLLKSNEAETTEKRFRAAITRWLTVSRTFGLAMPGSPPSKPELTLMCRDLGEMIDLRVLKVPAEEFTEGIPEPLDADVTTQFDKYKDQAPKSYTKENPFGFGYKQPDRVRLEYLLASEDVVQRVTRPADRRMRQYYREHTSEFVKEVPIPSTKPVVEQPTTAPATQPETRKVQKTYAESREEIAAILSQEAVQRKLDDVVARVEELAAEHGSFPAVIAAMKGSADDVLSRKIDVQIRAQRLDQAVASLARSAQLTSICYPWNAGGDVSVDPGVRVTLKAKGTTLAAALAEITEQVFEAAPTVTVEDDKDKKPARPAVVPTLKWATCELFPDVLFATGGPADLDMFPLSAGATGLVDRAGLGDVELLRNSYTSQSPQGARPLSAVAFTAKSFDLPPRVASMIKVGETGQPMYVMGDRAGRLAWTLVEAVPAHAPEALTDVLRKEVVDDLKIVRAFDLAGKRADELAAAAKEKGLEAVAKDAKKETELTGLFSRKSLALMAPNGMSLPAPGHMLVHEKVAWMRQMANYFRGQPLAPGIIWSQVGAANLPTEEAREAFFATAFSLAPEDVQPPYPAEPRAVGVAPVEADRTVLVLERSSFRPLVVNEYEKQARVLVGQLLRGFQQDRIRDAWFDFDQIVKRTGFKGRNEKE